MKTFLRGLLHRVRRSRYDVDLHEEIETHRALRQAAFEFISTNAQIGDIRVFMRTLPGLLSG